MMADLMVKYGRLSKEAELLIDALRGVAALMVLLSHGFEQAVAEMYGWDPHHTPGIWRFAKASLGNGDFLGLALFCNLGFVYPSFDCRHSTGWEFPLVALVCGAGAWLGASWDYLATRITKQLWIMAFGLCALFMSFEWILRF